MHLEPILAETRKAVEARKRASHRSSLEALAAAHTPRGFAAGSTPKVAVRPRDHRRAKKGLAVEGPHPARVRCAVSGEISRARRGNLPLRADRREVLSGQPLESRSRIGSHANSLPAQRLHRRRIPDPRGPGAPRGRNPADRRSVDRRDSCIASMKKPIGSASTSSAKSTPQRNWTA